MYKELHVASGWLEASLEALKRYYSKQHISNKFKNICLQY
jgi:hypothetical protein